MRYAKKMGFELCAKWLFFGYGHGGLGEGVTQRKSEPCEGAFAIGGWFRFQYNLTEAASRCVKHDLMIGDRFLGVVPWRHLRLRNRVLNKKWCIGAWSVLEEPCGVFFNPFFLSPPPFFYKSVRKTGLADIKTTARSLMITKLHYLALRLKHTCTIMYFLFGRFDVINHAIWNNQ